MVKRTSNTLTTCRFGKRFCETRLEPPNPEVCLVWRIAGFSLFKEEDYRYLHSPYFKAKGSSTKWWMSLYSKTRSTEDIRAYLYSSSKPKLVTNVTLSVTSTSGDMTNVHRFLYGRKTEHRIPNFLQWSQLLDQKDMLLPGDTLTINCSLGVVTQSVRIGYSPLPENCMDHGTTPLTDDFEEMLEDKTFADVVLKLGDTEINANRAILACRSPVFASMLNVEPEEEVIIPDVAFDVFRQLLRYLYTGKASFPSVDFTLNLLLAADKFEVLSLKSLCSYHLSYAVSQDNVLEVLFVADAIKDKGLTECCLKTLGSTAPSPHTALRWLQMCNSRPQISEVLDRLLKQQEQQSNTVNEIS